MSKVFFVSLYKDPSGKEPLAEWLESLRNKQTQFRILSRLEKIESGYLGDYKSVGDGIYELRLFFGAGYRIYYAIEEKNIILLLLGGDKSSQFRDIIKAKNF